MQVVMGYETMQDKTQDKYYAQLGPLSERAEL
jgi:hypothetical protein